MLKNLLIDCKIKEKIGKIINYAIESLRFILELKIKGEIKI